MCRLMVCHVMHVPLDDLPCDAIAWTYQCILPIRPTTTKKTASPPYFYTHDQHAPPHTTTSTTTTPTTPTTPTAQVDYTEEQGSLFFFKYPTADGSGEFLPVATTRPETILGDTAVAVHPEDARYQHLIGSELQVPMTGRRIRVIADEYVDMEFGTGALKITPGHDPNDYEIGQRVGLECINIMNNDATLNSNAGAYEGLERFAARKKLWADMEVGVGAPFFFGS